MRLVNGQLVPDVGESPIWDGAKWVYAPPIPGPRGGGGGCGAQGPAGPAGPAGNSPFIQEVYNEEQARPTVYSQPAPGGVFQTILSVNITTTIGTYLAIEANLSALTDGGALSTNTEAAIRLLVDGVSTGLGSSQSSINDDNNLEPFVALSLLARVPLLPSVLVPGVHVIRLQWMVRGDGAGNKLIGFLVPDQDGCEMNVREMVQV